MADPSAVAAIAAPIVAGAPLNRAGSHSPMAATPAADSISSGGPSHNDTRLSNGRRCIAAAITATTMGARRTVVAMPCRRSSHHAPGTAANASIHVMAPNSRSSLATNQNSAKPSVFVSARGTQRSVSRLVHGVGGKPRAQNSCM
jgi:hypothetical protein